MIKPLIKVIRGNITQGVTALPLKKSHTKVYEMRGNIRNDEVCIDRGETKMSRPSKKGNFSVSQKAFFLCAWVTVQVDDSSHVALITQFPFSDSFIKCFG
jgi:hypothetical protein